MHCNSAFGTTELHSYIIFFFSTPGSECSIASCFYCWQTHLHHAQEYEAELGMCASTGVTAQETHLQTQPSSHLEQKRNRYLKHSNPTLPYLPATGSRNMQMKVEDKNGSWGCAHLIPLSQGIESLNHLQCI